jgi:hypothetical protein
MTKKFSNSPWGYLERFALGAASGLEDEGMKPSNGVLLK